MTYKAFKYRLSPNQEQTTLLNKHMGCTRFVYNWALERKVKAYSESKTKLSCFDLQADLKQLKIENDWLKEVNSQSLQQSISHLDAAFSRFFKMKKGFPNFKKKSRRQSFTCPQFCKVDLDAESISIPKMLNIKAIISRRFEGTVKSVTVSKTPSGKFFASVLIEVAVDLPTKPTPSEATAVGIDLGIKDFCTLSTGEKVANPRILRNKLDKLKTLQKRLSRKVKGSKRRDKARVKVARLHEKISNKRLDFLHKLSTKLVRENQTICLEDLNVAGMQKNHCLAQAISDVSWSKFVELLTYKCDWYGKNLLKIGRFEPSSKMCSCGVINSSLTLKDREWTCSACGTIHDRDILAANNIKRFAFVGQNLIGQIASERRKSTPVESAVCKMPRGNGNPHRLSVG
jgi:putative transposase